MSYYKTPPGRQDEWLALYKKWHRPIIDYEIAHGVTTSAKLFAAGSRSPGQPWDFAIIIMIAETTANLTPHLGHKVEITGVAVPGKD